MRGQNLFLLIARIPPVVMLALISVLALAATFLVQQELSKKDDAIKAEKLKAAHKETCTVLLAKTEIPEGAIITADLVIPREVDARTVPLGSLKQASEVVGLISKVSIRQGEPFLSQLLAYPQKATGFEAKIPSGYRAVTFPVDASTGVAGFLSPDCRVDILSQSGSGFEGKVIPILSDVRVVAVGHIYKKSAGDSEAHPTDSVTVAVLPQDGAKIIKAMSAGKLYCLLRNQIDRTPLAVKDISSVLPRARESQVFQQELSTNLPPPVLPAVPQLHSNASDSSGSANGPRLHNVDIWQAAKKDEQSFSH